MSNSTMARTGLIRTAGALLLAAGTVLGLGRTASAQFAFEEDILPPRVVVWRLADRGFSGIGRPRFDGRVYVVDAVAPNGSPERLFVDPNVGAIVGRQRLGAPETYARLERPGPGFGWTEEDAGPRRILRPSPTEAPTSRPARRPANEAARPDANPYGVNPDGGARIEAPRKVARAAPPARQPDLKPALRTSPEAPAPKIAPADAAKSDSKGDPKPAAPAAAEKPAIEKPAEGARAEAGKPAAATKPAAEEWKDPPADKRPVRVIGGATIVPGTVEKETGAAQ